MLSELGASPSSNSGLVSSSTEPHLNTGHGVVHLWKERNGVRLCGLVRTHLRQRSLGRQLELVARDDCPDVAQRCREEVEVLLRARLADRAVVLRRVALRLLLEQPAAVDEVLDLLLGRLAFGREGRPRGDAPRARSRS